MLYEVSHMDSYITWPYQIADHHCRIIWVYNKKVSPGKDQKSLSRPLSQSIQKKTCAMVAQSSEDGEEAFTCVKVEGTRSKRKLKKCGINGLTSNDRAEYSAACLAQSNDGQTFIRVGKLNGWPVMVLRDTGCTGTIVDRAYQCDGDTRQFRLAEDGASYPNRCTWIPMVMCVNSPIYPVIIGNVPGARRMLPDPDWRAEDQSGV